MTRQLHIVPAVSAHDAVTAPPPPPDDPAEALVGRIVGGRYEIKRVLGRGGMGVVLLGEHVELEKPVAIKVLLASYARESDALKRFEREARSAAKLGHANIVSSLDFGRLETGEPFLVMEHVDGTDLVPLLGAAARGETSYDRIVALLEQIAAALDAVHAAGIVHRDVKAENILLTRGLDGRELVKLVDFGLAALADAEKKGARLTKVGMVIGTPEYLAPECARGALGDASSDQYSLAVLAFELLWGQPPIVSNNPMELLMKKVGADAPRFSSVTGRPSPVLDAALARGLGRDPRQRFESCAALVAQIKRGVEELTALPLVRSKPPPARTMRSDRMRRPPTAEVAAGGVAAEQAATVARGPRPGPVGQETMVLPRAPAPRTRGAVWIGGALLLALLLVGGGVAFSLNAPTAEATAPVVETPPIPEVVAPVVMAEALHEAVPGPVPEALDVPPAPTAPPGVAEGGSERAVTGAPTEHAPSSLRPHHDRASAPVAEATATANVESPREEAPAARPETTATRRSPQGVAATATEERAAPLTPQPSASAADLVRSAQAALLRGQVGEARDLFRDATRVSPRHAPAWRGLGIASEQMHEVPEARRAFERYLEIAPEAQDAETIRGRLSRLGG